MALGAEIEVPTLDGKVRYKISEGTSDGNHIQTKKQGNTVYKRNPDRRGDQMIRVTVETPKIFVAALK